MSFDYEKRLEAEVDRELKRLPELTAPQTLMLRVTAAIEKRPSLPWYRQSWQMWPLPLQAASFVLLMALFGLLCFGTWKLSHAESFAAAMQPPLNWLSGLGAIWHVLTVVLNSVALAVKQLGTGILIACAAALAMGYAMCVGLGTVYLRLALARR